MKTSELTGVALDWAVAKAEEVSAEVIANYAHYLCEAYSPSTNWAHGGPIIEREDIDIYRDIPNRAFGACHPNGWVRVTGPTRLIAAMRCFVASRLGDEIEIPKELLE